MTTEKKPRGFAALTPERRRELASKGGASAHRSGRAHQFTPAEASAAGRKGGVAPHVRRGRGPLAVAAPAPLEVVPEPEGA